MTVSSKAGRYELQTELGRGSMGVVYRAVDPVIGRTVAVKTVQLTAEVAGVSHDELLARFKTEARAAGLLAHPNIVVVYDAGEDDGLFYITMELVEGGSLQEQMNLRQSIPLPRVLRWMQQACSALEFAHQHSVVHRDIKPANLMLMTDDTLKITDFGTAKILALNTAQTANVIGTPSHMSPEQVKGKPVDGRTDIFSLGVVLYELLTGAKPFPGESVTSVIYKVVNEDPIPPRELDSSIHPGLSAIVQRALSKSPWARFQSCKEFAEALEHYKDFEEPRAIPRVPTTTTATKQEIPTFVPAIPEEQRNRSPLIAAALLLVIGAAGYRVWPAVREIWQRSHSADNAEYATGNSSPAQKTAASERTAPADQTTAPEIGASALASSTPSSSSSPTPDKAAIPTVTDTASAQPVVATDSAAQSATKVAAVAAARKTSAQISQDAAEWKDLIEAKLVEANIGDDVHVRAAGNSVTLTGKLDAPAHSKLLSQLQFVPAGLHIIDDIEYSEGPAKPTPPDSPPSAKQ